MKKFAAAAFGGMILALAATQAGAAIINIDAITNSGANPVSYTFAPGTYEIEWIGVADGGAFDAYKLGSTQPWSDAFIANSGDGLELHALFNQAGIVTFASAADALNAYRNSAGHGAVELPPNCVSDCFEFIPHPWIVHVDQEVTVDLFIGEALGADRSDNVGGVSLRIGAVPEPSTWAMMITGFGAAGAMLRRRRVAAVAA